MKESIIFHLCDGSPPGSRRIPRRSRPIRPSNLLPSPSHPFYSYVPFCCEQRPGIPKTSGTPKSHPSDPLLPLSPPPLRSSSSDSFRKKRSDGGARRPRSGSGRERSGQSATGSGSSAWLGRARVGGAPSPTPPFTSLVQPPDRRRLRVVEQPGHVIPRRGGGGELLNGRAA